VDSLSGRSTGSLVRDAMVVCGAVIAARFAWVFAAGYLPRLIDRRLRARDPVPAWRQKTVLAWSGMRGAVSLAAALALPLTAEADGSAEERSLDYQRLRRELLDAERGAVIELRRAGRIDDEVMRRVVRDLDLEDLRLDV